MLRAWKRWRVPKGWLVALLPWLLAGCAMLEPLLVDMLPSDDTQTAAGRSHAHCAWVLVTKRWPGGHPAVHLSGRCSGTLPALVEHGLERDK
jgi:hypothetical protein